MTTNLFLDFAKETTPIVIFAKQYDSDRSLSVVPVQNGVPLTIRANTSMKLNIKKPDGTYSEANAVIPEGRDDMLTVTIPAAALAVAGMAQAEIMLTASNKVLTSQPFYINIREAARGNAE